MFGIVAACSSDDRGFSGPPPLIDTSDAAVEAGEAAACAGRRCSRDLHQVLDGCTDAVVETCAADKACGGGSCTTPCAATALSQGSLGCSFWTVPPDAHIESDVSCFAAFIANTWSTPATVTATFGADTLDVSKSVYRAKTGASGIEYERIEGAIPAGDVGIVFLSHGVPGANSTAFVDCPKGVDVAYLGTPVAPHATSVYKAFHLETDVPVSAYSMFPYGGAQSFIPSATLLLPTTSWGTNYLLIDGVQANPADDPPFVQIVAQEDDTEVRIRPRADILEGAGVKGSAQGLVGTWTLQRGQVMEIHQPGSLAGSPLEASHPVAVFGGNQCPYIPAGVEACDTLQQQIAPIEQWGKSYSAVPYKSRRGAVAESVIWRIGAARDGTVLTYAPSRPEGAPLTLSSGDLVFFETDKPFSVSSQDAAYPLYLATYMSGAVRYDSDGDPDFVTMVPDEQFLDKYVFFVDYTFAASTLTVVRRKDADGAFHDVTLDCAGALTGWQPVGTDGTTELAWVDITRAGLPVATPKGSCGYGRHEASSDGPFALYVWGTDRAASYGYPAGRGSRATSPFRIVVR